MYEYNNDNQMKYMESTSMKSCLDQNHNEPGQVNLIQNAQKLNIFFCFRAPVITDASHSYIEQIRKNNLKMK